MGKYTAIDFGMFAVHIRNCTESHELKISDDCPLAESIKIFPSEHCSADLRVDEIDRPCLTIALLKTKLKVICNNLVDIIS